jgi:hypothetical protein
MTLISRVLLNFRDKDQILEEYHLLESGSRILNRNLQKTQKIKIVTKILNKKNLKKNLDKIHKNNTKTSNQRVSHLNKHTKSLNLQKESKILGVFLQFGDKIKKRRKRKSHNKIKKKNRRNKKLIKRILLKN